MTEVSNPTSYTNEMILTVAASNLAAATEAIGKNRHLHPMPKSEGPRRGLSRKEAAHYIGVSASTFDGMIKSKAMPGSVKIGSRCVWDIRALDEAFDALAAPRDANTWDTWG